MNATLGIENATKIVGWEARQTLPPSALRAILRRDVEAPVPTERRGNKFTT